MMEKGWHNAFNPEHFLRRVNIESLLERNAIDTASEIPNLRRPCFVCHALTGPGILLNEASYLCAECFKRMSLVQYPEKYEKARRDYLAARSAHALARQSMIEESWERRLRLACNLGSVILLVGIFWRHDLFSYLCVPLIGLFLTGLLLASAYRKKLNQWDQIYPQPKEPILRHFHDPAAELTEADRKTLYVFSHWPGYPPFWDYLRQLVKTADRDRCQVTGCPSRLSLHAHHIKPVSLGGEPAQRIWSLYATSTMRWNQREDTSASGEPLGRGTLP
jgi:hypothetical protein